MRTIKFYIMTICEGNGDVLPYYITLFQSKMKRELKKCGITIGKVNKKLGLEGEKEIGDIIYTWHYTDPKGYVII